MIENMIGAGSGALRADVRPAVARIDDAQPRQRKIAHRARGHADVLAKLRLDQNHNGTGQRDACFGLVGARTGHLTSLSDSTSEGFESSSEEPGSTPYLPALFVACPAEFLKQYNWLRDVSESSIKT